MIRKRLFQGINICHKYNNNKLRNSIILNNKLFHSCSYIRNDDTMNVSVNGKEVTVPKGCTVLQACEYADIDIPRFCYHDRLSIAGNCRMCLVEVEKSPKPVASCAMPAMPGMAIRTDTELVHKAREGVMEFLLANHPLDCPICDQGGECDLQDQSMVFGSDRSRFKEYKRSVEDKNLGPFVKTTMTRCIHCTRCVRFATEIAGVPTLGTTGRGNAMEIGTYVEKVMDSEISGNLVDLCPVGALTSKPFAFTARPWELHHTESIDVLDAVGANIRIDSRGKHVMRVQPRLNEDVNEEWLSDRSRYSYDGLERQRLDEPMIRDKNGKFQKATWAEAFNTIADNINQINGNEIKAIAGDLVDVESMVALKDLINRLGSTNHSCTTNNVQLNADVRDYRFNSSIAGIEDADLILLVNTNPRMEAPLINTRIRKSVVNYGTKVALIGPNANLTYPFEYLGNESKVLTDLANGKHKFSEQIKNAENPMIIVGYGALNDNNGNGIINTLEKFQKIYKNLSTNEWNGFNILHLNASQVGALDIGLVPGPDANDKNVKLVYLLGSEDVNNIPKDAFVIYQGHHGDSGAHRANVILPGLAYTEKEGTYVNMEGRPQHAHAAVGALGNAKNDWEILRALSEFLKCPLPYDNLIDIRRRMADIAPHLVRVDTIEEPSVSFGPAKLVTDSDKNTLTKSFSPLLKNHYQTNVISRSSKNMANASKQLPSSSNNYI